MTIAIATTKALFLPDLHVPYEDAQAVATALAFAKDFKANIVVALGDWMSSDQVSGYKSDCDVDLSDEFATVEEYLDKFRVTHYLFGNHEDRLTRPELVPLNMRKMLDPARSLHLVRRGIPWRPYDNKRGIFQWGKLTALHGFATNQYAARTTAEQYGACVFGHTHRFQTYQPKEAKVRNTGFNVGCLCKLDLQYARRKAPGGWVQGFAFAYLHKNGHFDLYPVRLVGPNHVIEGKLYGREADAG